MHLSLEGLIEDGIARVILNVLPASVAMSEIDFQSRKTSGSTEPHKIIQIKEMKKGLWKAFYVSLLTVCKCQSFDCSSPPSKSNWRCSAPCSHIWERIRYDAGQQPVVMATVPDVMHLSGRQRRSLFGLPKGVQLWWGKKAKRESFLQKYKAAFRMLPGYKEK